MKRNFILLFLLAAFQCRQAENLTPLQVIEKARHSFSEQEPGKFLECFSKNALARLEERVNELRKAFSTLPKSSLEGLSEKMGIPPGRLSRLSLEDYLKYRMTSQKLNLGSDYIVFPVSDLEPEDLNIESQSENETIYNMPNGRLTLILEDGHWKIDDYAAIEAEE